MLSMGARTIGIEGEEGRTIDELHVLLQRSSLLLETEVDRVVQKFLVVGSHVED
jgi:hypothetical protein